MLNLKKEKFLSTLFVNQYAVKEDPFPNNLGKIVYYRTYSRVKPEEKRREKWFETVERVVEFSCNLELIAMRRQGIDITEEKLNSMRKEAEKIYDLIFNLKLFPSGRTLWVGGTTSSYMHPLSNFNCSFMSIDNVGKFGEMFFILMLGTGVGLSVERQYVNKLPKMNTKIRVISKPYTGVPKSERKEFTELKQNNDIIEIVVGDSKFGWRKAIDFYFEIMTSKQYSDINYIYINYDNVREAGEPLKTFGGFASGHKALQTMFEKIYNLFHNEDDTVNKWVKIRPIDCLDIATIIAENVVSGGVRRSAEIVFCDKDEQEVLNAKANLYYQDEDGNWMSNDKILHRMLSNNTVFYKNKPSREELHDHFQKMRLSGEPAIANFSEMQRRRSDVQGGNPCFEIMLRDRGVCNLTEVNLMGFVNEDGTWNKEEMLEAQRLSAVIGYRMATIELELNEWNIVNEEDRLVGCSITGVMDFKNKTNISDDEFKKLLNELRETAQSSSYKLAKELGMNKPKLVTTIKPSGTISQLPTVSSGVHFSHSEFYIRRVRINANDALAKCMVESGFDWKPEVGQTVENHITKVFEFPVKAPKGKTKYDVSAIEQLELYKMVMKNYVDHNASNTIHVRDNEWEAVEEWVYNNWDDIVGVTFLSLDDSFYQLLPYEAISEDQYNEMIKNEITLNIDEIGNFENFADDTEIIDTECTGGACPVR